MARVTAKILTLINCLSTDPGVCLLSKSSRSCPSQSSHTDYWVTSDGFIKIKDDRERGLGGFNWQSAATAA